MPRYAETNIRLASRYVVWMGLVLAVYCMHDRTVIAAAPGVFDVRDYGATGDGKTLDTAAINRAIGDCSAAGYGQVRFPPGEYLSGTVHLKSNVTLNLQAGARLIGTSDVAQYQRFTPPRGSFEARLRRWHNALVLGEGVENVTITGRGVIDGNSVFDPNGEEGMRGPHTIIIGKCKNVTIRDVTMVDSANYAIMIEWSDDVHVRGVRVTGGWDGVHFRGSKDDPCNNLSVTDCQFFTGDDSIAGRYVENLLVEDCVINSSCNGIRIIGPMTNLIVHDCLFYGPGVHPHRTSKRHNMLSGIILQPGGWDPSEGPLKDVLISDVTMKNVASAITIWLKRPGNTIDGVTISRLSATGVYRAAASVESWTETPVGRVVFRDVDIEFAGGAELKQAKMPVRQPGVDARELPAWGIFARGVDALQLEDVRLGCVEDDLRHAIICNRVKHLTLDDLHFPHVAGAADPLVLERIGHVEARGKEGSTGDLK